MHTYLIVTKTGTFQIKVLSSTRYEELDAVYEYAEEHNLRLIGADAIKRID